MCEVIIRCVRSSSGVWARGRHQGVRLSSGAWGRHQVCEVIIRYKRSLSGTRGRHQVQEVVIRYKRSSSGTRGRHQGQEVVIRYKRSSSGTRGRHHGQVVVIRCKRSPAYMSSYQQIIRPSIGGWVVIRSFVLITRWVGFLSGVWGQKINEVLTICETGLLKMI